MITQNPLMLACDGEGMFGDRCPGDIKLALMADGRWLCRLCEDIGAMRAQRRGEAILQRATPSRPAERDPVDSCYNGRRWFR